MSTILLPRGRQTKLRLEYEATYGVNPGGISAELNTYTTTFSRARPLIQDDVLGGANLANTVDARPAAPNVEDASGKISVPLDLNQIGFWLAAALGRVTPTGSGTLTHAFSSGNSAVPSLFLERELVAAAQYEAMRGSVVKTMKLPFGPGSGYQMVDIDLVGAQVLEPYTATAAGTPSVEALAARVPKSVSLLKIAGAQIGLVNSGDITITNDITLDRYVGNSTYPGLAALEGISAEVTLSARYNTDALRAYGSLGTALVPPVQSLEVDYSLGASLSLTLLLPNVRFEPVDLPVTNGKTITVSLKGMAEVSTSAAMLAATLVNAHTAY